jgi:hypothetical protein
MNDIKGRTFKIRAALLRKKLLCGAPPDSAMAKMVQRLSDEELCKRDDEHTRNKIAWLATKNKS